MEDYQLIGMVQNCLNQISHHAAQQGNPVLAIVVFRECWPLLTAEEKRTIAVAFATRAAEIVVKGDLDNTLRDMIVAKFDVESFGHDGVRRVADAMVERAVRAVTGSAEYRCSKLYEHVKKAAADLAPRVAVEHVAVLEQRIKDALSDALVNDAMREVATAQVAELRRQAEVRKKT